MASQNAPPQPKHTPRSLLSAAIQASKSSSRPDTYLEAIALRTQITNLKYEKRIADAKVETLGQHNDLQALKIARLRGVWKRADERARRQDARIEELEGLLLGREMGGGEEDREDFSVDFERRCLRLEAELGHLKTVNGAKERQIERLKDRNLGVQAEKDILQRVIVVEKQLALEARRDAGKVEDTLIRLHGYVNIREKIWDGDAEDPIVKGLRKENKALKEKVVELTEMVRRLKKGGPDWDELLGGMARKLVEEDPEDDEDDEDETEEEVEEEVYEYANHANGTFYEIEEESEEDSEEEVYEYANHANGAFYEAEEESEEDSDEYADSDGDETEEEYEGEYEEHAYEYDDDDEDDEAEEEYEEDSEEMDFMLGHPAQGGPIDH